VAEQSRSCAGTDARASTSSAETAKRTDDSNSSIAGPASARSRASVAVASPWRMPARTIAQVAP
jgi:hypothetical protein